MSKNDVMLALSQPPVRALMGNGKDKEKDKKKKGVRITFCAS